MDSLRLNRNKIGRAALSIGAYVVTSIVLIGAIALLDHRLGAEQLKVFLTYVLITTIAAGLEPGTAKAALVISASKDGTNLSASMIGASLLKSVMVSPVIGSFWLFSDGQSAIDNGLVLVPVITALGFVATDLRVILDAKGKYAAAITLKQGSLSLAIACPAIAMMFGQGLAGGIIAGCALRALWTIGFCADVTVKPWQRKEFAEHLFSTKWAHLLLASGVGSLAASIDRLLAFRFLDAPAANAYVLLYEVLSKFWLLPYLLAPVVFVKAAQGGIAIRFTIQSHLLIAVAGLPFVLVAAAIPSIPFDALQSINFTRWGLILFAGAIVLASFNQILVAELQASGGEAAATLSAIAGLFVSAIAFPSLLLLIGFNGIFWAWILKSISECAVLSFATLRKRRI